MADAGVDGSLELTANIPCMAARKDLGMENLWLKPGICNSLLELSTTFAYPRARLTGDDKEILGSS